ncbi:MAG: FlgD immunoglobulin-like domain containing protein, partial [Bacteroidota bacterium]
VTLTEGSPFPNPFRTGGTSSLFIPVVSEDPQEGTLRVYNAAMDLVFDAGMVSHSVRGRQAFEWSGRTNDGEAAESGVYVLVVSLKDRVVTGKVALIRE